MIRGVALGLALVVTLLLTGCGIVVTDEAPTEPLELSAPQLVQAYPEVEALVAKPPRGLSLDRARALVRRAALEVRIPSCDDDIGRGFAVDAHTLVAPHDALSGGGWASVRARSRRAAAAGAATAYRLGDLGVARVARALPRRLPVAGTVAAGASVVVVTERHGKVRLLPGVVVDGVSGRPFGTRSTVLRVTSAVQEGDAGPVLDAKGRVVGAVFAVDPETTLGVVLPVAALRGRTAGRTLETLDRCDD